jgi:TonB family protein
VNGNKLRASDIESATDTEAPGEHCLDFDKTMPPSAFDGLAVSAGAGIYVLTADPALVATVRRTSGAHQAIVIVDEWRQLLEAVKDGRCGIALLDMEGAGGTLEPRIAELGQCVLPPVVIAAAPIGHATEPMQALTERKIHRLLIKPASPGNTRMVLEAAIARCQQVRQASGLPRTTSPTLHRKFFLGAGAGAALALAAIAVVALVTFATRDSSPDDGPRSVPGETPINGDIVRPGSALAALDPLAEQLAWADSALEVGLLADPPHDNALEGYATILAVDPDHKRARAGLATTVGMLYAEAEEALLGDSLDRASAVLEQVRSVQPDGARLTFLDAQLKKARALTPDPATETPAAATLGQGEIERLLGLSQDRIKRGQLVSPERDNAVAFFGRAAALDREHPAVVETRTALRVALVAAAEASLAAGAVEPVEPLIRALQSIGTSASILADLDQRLGAVAAGLRDARQAEMLATGLARMAQGQLVAPANDSAAFHLAGLMSENDGYPGLSEFRQALTEAIAANIRAAVAEGSLAEARELHAALYPIGADAALVDALGRGVDMAQAQAEFLATAVPVAELALVTARTPTYPWMALRNNIEGWVDLEFIVDRQGEPRDIAITMAEPVETFDRAAVAAVARYRFEPFIMDGVTYERRARVRVRFALD